MPKKNGFSEEGFNVAERSANIFNMYALIVMCFFAVVALILNDIGIFNASKSVMRPSMIVCIILFIIPFMIFLVNDKILKKEKSILTWKYFKIFIIFTNYIGIMIFSINLTYQAILFYVLPLLLAAQYQFDKKMFFILLVLTIVTVPLCCYAGLYLGLNDRNLTKNIVGDTTSIEERIELITNERLVEIFFHHILPRLFGLICIEVLAFGITRRNKKMADIEYSLNEKIHEEMRKKNILQSNVIEDLASVIETRDVSTGEHVKRTKRYVGIIARELAKNDKYKDILTEEKIQAIEEAAPLHDVGKISVSDTILLKPAKLSDEEFNIMKKHTTVGGEMIKNIFKNFDNDESMKEAYNIALYHHEKWNGKGYPEGLKEEDIPLSARIMAIADVFDALVSKRVYKDSMQPHEAFQVLINDAGSHFDPDIMNVIKNIEDDIIKASIEEL